MAYLDDWSGVPSDEQRKLQQPCEACSHMRYFHGKAREVKAYGFHAIDYEAGPCVSCACLEFQADPLMTKDDVLDLIEKVASVTRLSDMGIGPVACPAVITRWAGSASLLMHCSKTGGHSGEHET